MERYVEQDQSAARIAREMRLEPALVDEIFKKTDRAEFKRRQACPGVKITEQSFGKGRRVPIIGPPVSKMLHEAETLSL